MLRHRREGQPSPIFPHGKRRVNVGRVRFFHSQTSSTNKQQSFIGTSSAPATLSNLSSASSAPGNCSQMSCTVSTIRVSAGPSWALATACLNIWRHIFGSDLCNSFSFSSIILSAAVILCLPCQNLAHLRTFYPEPEKWLRKTAGD